MDPNGLAIEVLFKPNGAKYWDQCRFLFVDFYAPHREMIIFAPIQQPRLSTCNNQMWHWCRPGNYSAPCKQCNEYSIGCSC